MLERVKNQLFKNIEYTKKCIEEKEKNPNSSLEVIGVLRETLEMFEELLADLG